MNRIGVLIMNLVGVAIATAFFLVPIIKLKEPALAIVVLIGVGCALYAVYEEFRSRGE